MFYKILVWFISLFLISMSTEQHNSVKCEELINPLSFLKGKSRFIRSSCCLCVRARARVCEGGRCATFFQLFRQLTNS